MKKNNFALKNSDERNIYKYQQDKEVKKNFMSVPKNIAEVKNEINNKNKLGESFVIDINGEAVGEVSIWHDDRRNKTKIKISCWLAKEFRGEGIMTEAVKIVTNYAFKKYKLARIYGHVRTFNKPSARVMEKAGYKLEGILRKNVLKNGKLYDDFLYAKVRR